MELAAASVVRSIRLPVGVHAAWASLRDADGLAGWLGDAVDLDVAVGATGTITEGAARRRVVVTEVEEGRRLGLVWWDEDAPAEASVVTIDLASGDHGTTTVTVTERRAGAASASLAEASVADLIDAAGASWDRRLRALVGEPAWAPAGV